MLQTVLHILAIIGIVILCIFVILLLVLLAVLLVPIRYDIRGRKESDLWLRAKVTWFLHAVSVTYEYPQPNSLLIKILGFKVSLPSERVSPLSSTDIPEHTEAEDTVPESAGTEPPIAREAADSKASQSTGELTAMELKTSPKPDSLWERITKAIAAFLAKIRYTIRFICDRIKKLSEGYEYYTALLREEETKLLFKRSKSRLIRLMKHIRPRKLDACLTVGTGSPDTTGYLLGLYGMLLPYLGNTVTITPDFEQAVLKGTFRVKGRVTVLILLITVIQFYFDKQLRIFIDKLQREDVTNG